MRRRGVVKPVSAEAVLERLAGQLAGSTLRQSTIESVLADAQATMAVRKRVEAELVSARITVVEDVEATPFEDTSTIPTRSAPARDPREAARHRLSLDHGRPPHRLAKVILTAEEEVGLTLLARPDGAPLDAGGFASLDGECRAAAESMLLHNMGLVHSVAQKRVAQGLDYEDLVAHGVPGLVRAIEKFDPTLGLKFSTYAMHWVQQSIGRAIDNEGRIIRLPVHVCESIRQVKAAQERLTVDGKMPSWKELALECHLTVEKVAMLLRLAPAVVSLDKPVGNDGLTLGDLLDRPAQGVEPVNVHGLDGDDLTELLTGLPGRETDVLRRRHGLAPYEEGQTLDDIGKVYGLTRERIRQIEKTAMTTLRVRLGLEQPKQRKKRRARTPRLALDASA